MPDFIPAFGRIPSKPDERNWDVSRLMTMVDEGLAVPVTWETPVVLNQRQTPHCVGFSGAHYIATAQAGVPADATVTDAMGHALYYECKVRDGAPLSEVGSSIHSLMIVLKNKGVIDAYAWAPDTAACTAWLEKYGPVVTGMTWFAGMCYPDAAGVMHVTGTIQGGHATIIHGWTGSLFDFVNSWGPNWGKGGHGYMAPAELETVFHRMGEFAMAVKFVRPTPPPYQPPTPPKPAVPWPDLPPEYAAAGWRLWNSGIFQGYPDGTFGPNQPVSDLQLATVFGRLTALRTTQGKVTTRLDMLELLDWFLSKE